MSGLDNMKKRVSFNKQKEEERIKMEMHFLATKGKEEWIREHIAEINKDIMCGGQA